MSNFLAGENIKRLQKLSSNCELIGQNLALFSYCIFAVKTIRRFLQNFVAFSENLNFMINYLFFRPPRPRPEGGQDPSPNFLNEGELPGSAAVAAAGFKENLAPHNSGKKQDDLLIIDSWTGKI